MPHLQAKVVAKKYRLNREIYSGELSSVYEASLITANRKARQIPLILKTIARSEQDVNRIHALKNRVRSESQALASLNNPFIVKAIAYGEYGTIPYLVMRRRSTNLSQYLKAKGKLSLVQAVPLLYNLATALDYAHSQGFIHRDIKPDNILLDLDEAGLPLYAYITDFGIAQSQDRLALTKTNDIIGTMAYMPPERLEMQETTSLSDVYAFGLVAYEMLAGVSLFRQVEAVQDQINLILNPRPEFFKTIKAKLDADVAVVILKAISRKPEDRYATATQFAVSLGQLLPASQLANVNQEIDRNFSEAGRADETALWLLENEDNRFSALWLLIAVLAFFGIGFLIAEFLLNAPDASASDLVFAEMSEEATEGLIVILATATTAPTLTASPVPSTHTPTPTETLQPSHTPSFTPSPSLTLSPSPTITYTPSVTPTPRPEVDCEGASWLFHRANRGDTLSHYVYSLVNQSAFEGMDYEQRASLIRRVNEEVDFEHLAIGQLVCLPAVPPMAVSAPTAVPIGETNNTAAIPNDGGTSSQAGGGSSSGNGNSGSGGSSSGGLPATPPPVATDVPPPTAIPISVSVSSSCSNGNSGGTTFRVSNNGSATVSISWRLMNGGNQVASGNLSLSAGQSSTAWSGNTKNSNYSLTVNETGASSGESCG